MGRTRRKEFYLTKGRIELIVNERPSGFGPWPKRSNHRYLIVAIEDDEYGRTQIFRGPSYTEKLEIDALLLHRGLYLNQNNSDVDSQLPMTVIKPIKEKIAAAVKKMVRKFARLSNEERMTGALFSDIEFG